MQRKILLQNTSPRKLFLLSSLKKIPNIVKLVVSNGNPQTSIKQIINICQEFYANLYKQKTTDSKIQTFLSEFSKKLKPHQQIDLGNKIIKIEAEITIAITNNDKTNALKSLA